MEDWLIKEQQKNKNLMGEAYEKYDKPGVYAIKLFNQVVYIGKSVNMAHRIVSHMVHIEHLTEKTNKYQVLHEAQRQGHQIQFSVLSYCPKEDIGREEARLIHEYRPVLNYQIPKLSNPKSFTVNKRAKYITLQEIAAGLA